MKKNNNGLLRDLRASLSKEAGLLQNVSLRKKTTLGIGGDAQIWCEPAHEHDLITVLKLCHEHNTSFFMIGRGSKLLAPDDGYEGVLVSLSHKEFRKLDKNNSQIYAGAGASLQAVFRMAKHWELSGLEFLEGIPGTIGGAFRMNAGAMGQSISEVAETIRYMDYTGRIIESRADQIDFEYRNCSLFQDHIVLSATLNCTPSTTADITAKVESFRLTRRSKQPYDAVSAGCIFKNPREISAGALIEQLGFKGMAIGGASVSTKHANFIVSDGTATAANVLELIELIKTKALAERGITLETELIII